MRTCTIPLFILTVFLLTGFYAKAQVPMNQKDGNGWKQGVWIKKDSAGQLVYRGQFRDNIPYDTFRYYYPEGKLKTLSVFSDSGRVVRSVSYFTNGKPMAKGVYRDQKRDSIWQFFSEYDTVLLSEENYRNGIREGISKIYFPAGGVSEITNWKMDVRDGPCQEYYTDGKIKMTGLWKSGEKDGAFLFFYPSGQTMISGDYLEGHQHGIWKFFSDSGEVVRTEKYNKGSLLDRTPKDPPAEQK